MKNLFKNLFNDKIIFWGFIFAFIFLSISFILAVSLYTFLPPFLPLYNKMPWGYARVGSKIELFFPIGLAFLLFLTNIFISAFTYNKAIILGRFISATTFVFALSTCVFVIQLILLVR